MAPNNSENAMVEESIKQGKMLCQRVALDGESNKADWSFVIDALSAARDAHDGYGKSAAAGEFPFADIIIKDRQSTDETLAASLAEELEVVFANYKTSFACDSFYDNDVAKRCAFFGHGVFAPIDGLAEHSADIEFSWNDPNSHNHGDGSGIITALLASGGRKACAWHTGQKGLAVGFSADVTPATLELPADMELEAREAFRQTFLFIGRDASYAPPRVDLMPAPGCKHSTIASLHESKGIESLLSGKWIRFHLQVGEHKRDLWCRYAIRSADSRFSPAIRPDTNRPYLAVRGFIMPEIKFMFGLNPLKRWFVHFDSMLNLKYADFTETRRSIIRQSFNRLAVYDHQPSSKNRWAAGEVLPKGMQRVSLNGDIGVEIQPFPGKIKFAPNAAQTAKDQGPATNVFGQFKQIYQRNEWVLVNLTNYKEIGFLDIDEGRYNLACAAKPKAFSSSQEREVGIDWLNRMAQLEVNSTLTGAALHWASKGYFAEVVRNGNDFIVKVKNRNNGKSIEQTIPPAHRGMLGPILVENMYEPNASGNKSSSNAKQTGNSL